MLNIQKRTTSVRQLPAALLLGRSKRVGRSNKIGLHVVLKEEIFKARRAGLPGKGLLFYVREHRFAMRYTGPRTPNRSFKIHLMVIALYARDKNTHEIIFYKLKKYGSLMALVNVHTSVSVDHLNIK